MKKMFVPAAIVFGLLGVAGHAEGFPQAALTGMTVAGSASRAPTGMQALQVGFPMLGPVGPAAAGSDRPPHEVQAASIQFPGVAAPQARAVQDGAAAAEVRKLQMNRFQAISLR